ncbi:MAG: DUF1207 domain-containing protein [Planctomycetota bacterium]
MKNSLAFRRASALLIVTVWTCVLNLPAALAQQPVFAPPGDLASQFAVAEPYLPPATVNATPWLDANDASEWRWRLLPEGFIYHTYWASAAEPRLATHLVHERGRGRLLDSHIGGRVGLIRFGPKNEPEGLQLDILGGAKLRQDAESHLEVDSVDFRYDILLTYGDGPDRYKIGYYHVSSHVADDFFRKNPDFMALNFLRDVLVVGYSYYPWPELRLYGEAGYAFNVDISQPWEFQAGVDYGPAGPTGNRGAPFFAINGHLREELDFGGNLALQTGWAWRGDRPGDGTLRTGGYYYNGGSPQFSFFDDFAHQLGWGLWYDY